MLAKLLAWWAFNRKDVRTKELNRSLNIVVATSVLVTLRELSTLSTECNNTTVHKQTPVRCPYDVIAASSTVSPPPYSASTSLASALASASTPGCATVSASTVSVSASPPSIKPAKSYSQVAALSSTASPLPSSSSATLTSASASTSDYVPVSCAPASASTVDPSNSFSQVAGTSSGRLPYTRGSGAPDKTLQNTSDYEIEEPEVLLDEDCIQQSLATEHDIIALKNFQPPNSRAGRCLLACMYKKISIITPEGKYSIDGGLVAMKRALDPYPKVLSSVVSIIDQCALKVNEIEDDSDGCEVAAALFTCIVNNVEGYWHSDSDTESSES
ncbi:uncharacterized protein LOC143915854 [Arctopsyche grandis]|uniref:uncharacterized protein LOC143915854 n=1 Tax=Arctopsyche grandis TaxID=121162 RepID=UPI00406D6A72